MKPAAFIAFFSAVAVSLAAYSPATDAATLESRSLATSQPTFCAEIQRRLVDTPLAIRNVIHQNKDAFTDSKASVAPLVTHQFIERDEAGTIREISCKTKTADHLRALHGSTAARDPMLAPRSCRDMQRAIVLETWAALNVTNKADTRYVPHRVMLDPDARSYTGSSWVGSSAEAYLAADGRLHLRASALFAEWEDWRWKLMPKSFRGNHYCHLVAPERLQRLMTGAETPLKMPR